ncbi:hypothetical protein B0H14DRAFT_2629233 [Mycena olivaceomarginata]|nr:hypothetical protein B0H14DRAFT_2629233 [Mycena olivaceomarginata]
MEGVRSNRKEAGQSNHKVVRWLNQKKGGWTVKPEESRKLWAEVQAGKVGTRGRRYPEHNLEGHGQEDDRWMTTRGKATTNKRKKSKLEEEGRRELAGEGIKPWK